MFESGDGAFSDLRLFVRVAANTIALSFLSLFLGENSFFLLQGLPCFFEGPSLIFQRFVLNATSSATMLNATSSATMLNTKTWWDIPSDKELLLTKHFSEINIFQNLQISRVIPRKGRAFAEILRV